MIEHWERWEPIKKLSKKYYIDGVSNNMEGFKIILSEDVGRERISILFENSVAYFQYTNETFRLKTVGFLKDQYGKQFYVNWTFFKIINSFQLKWLSEQSCEISDSLPFIHFAFITPEAILDVISTYEPKIELIETR